MYRIFPSEPETFWESSKQMIDQFFLIKLVSKLNGKIPFLKIINLKLGMNLKANTEIYNKYHSVSQSYNDKEM